jgi:hypothetical protein
VPNTKQYCQQHENKQCTFDKPKCVNCKGEHPSSSKTCPQKIISHEKSISGKMYSTTGVYVVLFLKLYLSFVYPLYHYDMNALEIIKNIQVENSLKKLVLIQ